MLKPRDRFKQVILYCSMKGDHLPIMPCRVSLEHSGCSLGANRQHLKSTLDGIVQWIKFDDAIHLLWV